MNLLKWFIVLSLALPLYAESVDMTEGTALQYAYSQVQASEKAFEQIKKETEAKHPGYHVDMKSPGFLTKNEEKK